MSEFVKRVVETADKQLVDQSRYRGVFYARSGSDAINLHDLCRAILKEVRNPTDEMVRCGLEAMFACDDGYEASLRAALSAVVDSALKEEK